MDHILFVEYRLNPEMRARYRAEVLGGEHARPVEWLESQEQPGLYVEIWRIHAQEAAKLGESRTDLLQPFLVPGSKVKRWLFQDAH